MKTTLQDLRDMDPSSERYKSLISQITANFDKYHDDGTLWLSSKANTRKDRDHEFIGYTFKRKKVCISLFSSDLCKDVVRAALTADTFGMGDSPSGSSLRGPPEPAPKRPHSQYNTPLSHSPASDPSGSETGSEISPPPDDRGARGEVEGSMTTIFRSPPLEGERKPPLSPAPTASSSVTTPIAIRPQSDDIHQPFSI